MYGIIYSTRIFRHYFSLFYKKKESKQITAQYTAEFETVFRGILFMGFPFI